MRPMILMLPADPLRTVTLPERVRTSRSAVPLTLRFLSKWPCSEAAAATVARSTQIPIAREFFIVRRMSVLLVEWLFIAQRLHRCHVGRALRRIHSGGQGDDGECDNGHEDRNRRNDRMRNEIGQGQIRERQARTHAERQAEYAARGGEQCGFR